MSRAIRDEVEIYRRMLLVRRFEEAVIEQRAAGMIPGALHCSIGQEAAIVGACMALRDDDYVFGSHRAHGHPIAKGAGLPALMAELMGRKTGVCKGKGGSMHLADHSVGVMGESGIVGAGIPLATGAGLSIKVRRTRQVSLCFFGDGASNEGAFHESLNMAAIWKLPVIYFCENNLYAATTPLSDALSIRNIAERSVAYGIPGEIVDGQDAFAVHEVTASAARRAREGEGPTLLEAKTYRYREHAEGLIIPVSYRDADEVERWKQRDPLEICRRRLMDADLLDDAYADELEAEVAGLVRDAVDFAKASEFPEPSDSFTDMCSPFGADS